MRWRDLNTEEKFLKYYYEYLGIEGKKISASQFIFKCNQRDKPINTWYYQHLIATNIEGRIIFSVSPGLYQSLQSYITLSSCDDFDELISILEKYFAMKIENSTVRLMYRLTIDEMNFKPSSIGCVFKLSKEILMNNLEGRSLIEKEAIWSRKKEEVEQGRQFVSIHKNKIISYCKISNIDYCGGNLTVWTAPEFRGKQYGKEVVTAAVKWCFQNNILPIYWVDSTNKASLNLALALGFKIKSKEVVVSSRLR